MSNWNICEDLYPGPAYIKYNQGAFTVAGQITTPIPPHLRSVPEVLKVGDVYFQKNRPSGIIVDINTADQTFTYMPQGTYFR